MEDHIRDLLSRFQYSEQLQETAVFRILFGGEEVSQMMEDLGIHSGHTLRIWVQLYARREDGFVNFTRHEASTKARHSRLKTAK